MKNNALLFYGLVLLSLVAFSCSKTQNDTGQVSLKSAVLSSSNNLNNAMTAISTAKAFDLLSVSSADALKAATVYNANIPLSMVKGVYDYKSLGTASSRSLPLIRFFNKSADNANMVINMPVAKLKNPGVLRSYQSADAGLTNNFTISVSDYHNNYNSYHDFDYVNVADITVDNAKAGSLNIKSFISPELGRDYSSSYAFENGYTAKYAYKTGDPTTSSFTLLKGAEVVYQEEVLTSKVALTDNDDEREHGHERQYNLTIGNVKIVRNADRTVQVFVNGSLQPNAVVKVVDDEENEGEERSICHKRDLQITFEDGTTAKITDLIGQSVENISALYKSLRQVYFAAYVVDWLAYDIYYKR